jgi:hypothetical protein
MSAFKVVSGDVDLTNEACILQTLEAMGLSVEHNTVCKQRWSFENMPAELVVRQNQLPEYVQGFGDLGLILKDGKYQFLACSEHDSAYMDRDKRSALMQQGVSSQEALQQQPNGRFQQDQAEFMKVIENGYALFELANSIKKKCPSAVIQSPTGVEGQSSAWMMAGSISKTDKARLAAASRY